MAQITNLRQRGANRINFTGFSVSVKDGGILLDAVKTYLQELRRAYEWHPSEIPMDELGNDDDFY